MLSFAQYLEESMLPEDYNLQHKFDHFNQLLFENRVPHCPLTCEPLDKIMGMTEYTSTGRTIVPGSLSIKISSKFRRSEANIDSTMIHEMIHAFLAVSFGDGDTTHGRRFQLMASSCSHKAGIPVYIKHNIGEYDLIDDAKVLTTVLMKQDYAGKWSANFFSGSAFDSQEKLDQLIALWGAPGRLKEGEQMLVVKIQSNLFKKYGMSRSSNQLGWAYINPKEEQEILQGGQLVHCIVPNSISHEDSISKMPTKEALVILQTNPKRNTVYGVFLMPNIARDHEKMLKLLAMWKGYYTPGTNNIDIFTTQSTIFNRGFSMKRNAESRTYYNLKPETVAELRRNANYIVRWA